MIIETKVVQDYENGNNVFSVKFSDSPTLEDRQAAFKLAPFPWGTFENPQIFKSSVIDEPGWWDVGNA